MLTPGHYDQAYPFPCAAGLLGGPDGVGSEKIRVLDPDGDIPDPIGGPPAVYRETAERIRKAIEKRFEELGL